MGYNHWHRTAYYANLNLNTMQTFAQHRAVEITRKLILGTQMGRNPQALFGELGIFTPQEFSYSALQAGVRSLTQMGVPPTQNMLTLLEIMRIVNKVRLMAARMAVAL